VNVAQLDHRGGRFGFAFIVLAVASRTAIPRIRALHNPAFAYGCKAFAAYWSGLHLNAPARSILRQPLFERMIVILGIAVNFRRSSLTREFERRRYAIVKDLVSLTRVVKFSLPVECSGDRA